MFSENNQISARQAFRLLVYDLLGFSTLLVPTAVAERAEQDGIFCILLGVAGAMVFLIIIGKAAQGMTGTYLEYLIEVFGKFWGKVLAFGYLIYFLLLGGYSLSLLSTLVVHHLLGDTSYTLVLFLILLLVLYGVSGGIQGRARIYELLFWFLLIPLFLMLFFACKEVDTAYWTPVFNSPGGNFLLGSYETFACFSLEFLLLFVGGFMSQRKKVKKIGTAAVFFTGVVHIILYLILLGIFGAAYLQTMDFAVIEMMSQVQMTGSFLKRTDTFMFAIWFFTLYALISSMAFYGEKAWLILTNQKAKKIVRLGIFLLIGALGELFYLWQAAGSFYKNLQLAVGTPGMVLIPVLVVLAEKRRKGSQWEANELEKER